MGHRIALRDLCQTLGIPKCALEVVMFPHNELSYRCPVHRNFENARNVMTIIYRSMSLYPQPPPPASDATRPLPSMRYAKLPSMISLKHARPANVPVRLRFRFKSVSLYSSRPKFRCFSAVCRSPPTALLRGRSKLPPRPLWR